MNTTYVFVSHCVRPGDPAGFVQSKRELIDFLEENGFGVFDYVERPGSWRDWLDEIREQLSSCGCVVYFAKQWPEDNPGVVMIELGAAVVMGKPVFIYCPGPRPGDPFTDYSAGLCSAINSQREIVFEKLPPLLPKLQGVHRKKTDAGEQAAIVTLTEAFFGKAGGETSPLRTTRNVFRALLQADPLHLKPVVTLNAVQGMWSMPSARAVITVKSSGNGTSMQPFVHEGNDWAQHEMLRTGGSAPDVLHQVYSIGFSASLHRSWVLLCEGAKWRFITQGADHEVSAPSGLERSIRRTFIAEHPDSRRLVFYADGEAFEINPGECSIKRCPADHMSAVVADDFLGNSDSRLPRRLAKVHGTTRGCAFLSGGRAEAYLADAGGVVPGCWFHGEQVQLGAWEPADSGALLRCLLPEHNPWFSVQDRAREVSQGGYSNLPSTLQDEFDWLLQLLRRVDPTFTELTALSYNQNENEPALLLPAVRGSCLSPQKTAQPGYHRLALTWTNELRRRLWEVAGHGHH